MQNKIKYLKTVFGKAKLQNNGIELMVPCPSKACSKKTNKLKMNIRLDNELYHCWSCSLKGKNIGRLIKMKNPSMVSGYFDKFKSGFTYNNFTSLSDFDPVILPDGFKLLMESLHDPDAMAIRKYAHKRGITDELLWRGRIGYSTEWKYSRRLIMPSFTLDGTLNYWVSRTIDPDNPYTYLNAKAEKSNIIFGEIDIDWEEDYIFLVEGPLDYIKTFKLNASCLLGSSISEDSVLFYNIVKNSMDVILALDPDAWKKQLKIAELFSAYDLNVFLASPKEGDIGDISSIEVEQLYHGRLEYNKDYGYINHVLDKI